MKLALDNILIGYQNSNNHKNNYTRFCFENIWANKI